MQDLPDFRIDLLHRRVVGGVHRGDILLRSEIPARVVAVQLFAWMKVGVVLAVLGLELDFRKVVLEQVPPGHPVRVGFREVHSQNPRPVLGPFVPKPPNGVFRRIRILGRRGFRVPGINRPVGLQMAVARSHLAFRIEGQDIESPPEPDFADFADTVIFFRYILEIDFSYVGKLHPVFTKIQGPGRKPAAERSCVVPVTRFVGVSSCHHTGPGGSAEGGIRISAGEPHSLFRQTVQVRSPGDGSAAAHVIGVVLVGDYDDNIHCRLE